LRKCTPFQFKIAEITFTFDTCHRLNRKNQQQALRIPDPDDDPPHAGSLVVPAAKGEEKELLVTADTPAASKNAFSALMSSGKAVKATAVVESHAVDTTSRDLFSGAGACEEGAGKGRGRGRKGASVEDGDTGAAAGAVEAKSRGGAGEKGKAKGAGRKKKGAKEAESSEDGDAEAGPSDDGEELEQAGSKRGKAAIGKAAPTPPPPAPAADTAKTPVQQKETAGVLGMLRRQGAKVESPPVPLAAADTAAAADAAAAEASGTGDAAKTPAASKNAFSALMSSGKAVKATAVVESSLTEVQSTTSLSSSSLPSAVPLTSEVPVPKNAFATLMQPNKSIKYQGAPELDENGWETSCHVCRKTSGELICCEFGISSDDDATAVCPRVFHAKCVGLSKAPKGEFICPFHSLDCEGGLAEASCGAVSGGSNALQMLRWNGDDSSAAAGKKRPAAREVHITLEPGQKKISRLWISEEEAQQRLLQRLRKQREESDRLTASLMEGKTVSKFFTERPSFVPGDGTGSFGTLVLDSDPAPFPSTIPPSREWPGSMFVAQGVANVFASPSMLWQDVHLKTDWKHLNYFDSMPHSKVSASSLNALVTCDDENPDSILGRCRKLFHNPMMELGSSMLQHIVPPAHNCWSTAQQPPVQASSLSCEYGPSELLIWLEKFVSHHGLKVKARKKRPRIERGRYEQPPSKGIILVGDSGVGKTSSVYAAADSMGMNILEMNPGQRRNGKNVMDFIGEAATTQSLNSNQSSNSDSVMILFDEADIIFPDDDKGFIAAVSNVLAVSKRPVVITCSSLTESLASLDLPVISFQSVALLNVVAISCCAARAARRTIDYASSFLLVSRHPGDCRRALCHLQLHSCKQDPHVALFAAAVAEDLVINVDSDSELQLDGDDDAPMVRAHSSSRKRLPSEAEPEAAAEEAEDVLRGIDYDGVCLTAAFRNVKEVGNCSYQDTKSKAVFPYVEFLDVLSLHSQRQLDNNAAMKSIIPMLQKFSNLQDALNMHLPITVSVCCRSVFVVVEKMKSCSHNLFVPSASTCSRGCRRGAGRSGRACCRASVLSVLELHAEFGCHRSSSSQCCRFQYSKSPNFS
jgi:hypothetical protein